MEGLIMAAQLILGLSILVGLHEAGHMLAAKMFGMRVEQFSIGFPPKVFSFKWGETEYSLGALPLGGFVKITGMIDESLDTENMKNEPEPYEFRAKPAWQRLIVMLGGIIVNVITGVIVFIILAFVNGESILPIDSMNQNGIAVNEYGKKLGLQDGDKLLEINGMPLKTFEEARDPNFLLTTGSYYLVERNGEKIKVFINDDFIKQFSSNDEAKNFMEPRVPFVIKDITPMGDAEKAGLLSGDLIKMINGENAQYFQDFVHILSKNKGKSVTMVLLRNGEVKELQVNVNEKGKIGIAIEPLLEKSTREYEFGEAMSVGTTGAFNVIWINVMAFKKMFDGTISPVDSLGGPIEIARKFYGGVWDWLRFWTITGMLSMVLAFMNLLPIPALDGGHVVFILYEIVSGRAPSDKFLENAQKVGMILLLTLMVLVFGKDLFMLVRDFLK